MQVTTKLVGDLKDVFDVGDGASVPLLDEVRSVLKARKAVAIVEQSLKQQKSQLRAMEDKLIERLLAEIGKSIRLEDGTLVTVGERRHYRLPTDEAERQRVVRWMKRVGAKALFKETIHPQSLNSFLRERREDGRAIDSSVQETVEHFLRVTAK